MDRSVIFWISSHDCPDTGGTESSDANSRGMSEHALAGALEHDVTMSEVRVSRMVIPTVRTAESLPARCARSAAMRLRIAHEHSARTLTSPHQHPPPQLLGLPKNRRGSFRDG